MSRDGKKLRFLLLLIFILHCSCQVSHDAKESFRFVFLTDIHLQPERRAVEGFRAAINAVNNLDPKPAFVVTGGDMIMDALNQKFERADSLYDLYSELTTEFDMPVYNCIGNHEIFGLYKKSGISPGHPEYGKAMYKKRVGNGKTYQSFDYQNWHIIILDAIGFTPERTYYGHIDQTQLDWLKSDLETVGKTRPVVIALHIPLYSVYHEFLQGPLTQLNKGLVVGNANEVTKICEGYKVKLVLQGHLHILEEIIVNGTHYITGGAVSAAWWNGPHYNSEEGFVVVDIDGEDFTWYYHDYGWTVESEDKE